eukprot:gene12160-12298_t
MQPKLVNHFRTCRGQSFTCVDCSRTFDRQSAQEEEGAGVSLARVLLQPDKQSSQEKKAKGKERGKEKKKLKKKGSLKLKKLEQLVRGEANGSFSQDIVEAVKQQLLNLAHVKLDNGSCLVWQQE